MGKHAKRRKGKVRKMTEEEYAAYIMSLKDQTPPKAYERYAAEEITFREEEKER